MVKKAICYLSLAVLSSCHESADERFTKFQHQFEHSIAVRASQQTDDYVLDIPKKERLFADYQFLRQQHQKLNQIASQMLSPHNQVIYDRIRNTIVQKKNSLVNYRNDPSRYNIGGKIKEVLSRESLALPNKLDTITELLIHTGAYYDQAIQNIYRPVPGKARIGSQKQLLTLKLLQNELRDSVESAQIPTIRKREVLKLTSQARIEIKKLPGIL